MALVFRDRVYGEGEKAVTVFGDTDYAGCPVSRRSTNGGVVFDSANPLRAWSTAQATVVMSSGEAELYGYV